MGNIFDTNIVDITHDNMMEYFNEINTSRQIPDLRDGLKPIQRKILYTMYKNGYRSDKKHVKSARVSGDTTLLHPHSNDGIYDTATNMINEFEMNQPLIDGQGNFGSITGASAAAARYCLTGNSLIELDNGKLIKIKDIVKDTKNSTTHKIDINVKNYKLDDVHASKFFNSGFHPVMNVTLNSGREIEGTFNHPILTFSYNSKGKIDLVLKTLDELKVGDYLVYKTEKNFEYDNEITESFRDEAKRLVNSNLNYNFEDGIEEHSSEKIMVKEFNELDPAILSLGRSEKVAVIRELLDNYFCMSDKEIYFINDSKYLLSGLGNIFRQFNIHTTIETIPQGYKLNISNYSSINSLMKITIDGKHLEYLNRIKNNLIDSYSEYEYSKIPYLKDVLSNLNISKEKIDERLLNRKYYLNDYYKLEDIYGIEDVQLSYLNKLIYKYIDNSTYFEKITNIEESGERKVYSIRVDTNDHIFQAEGFFHHNTEMKLNKFSEKNMLEGINHNSVNMVKNFDGSVYEPEILPTKLPYVLINGSFGIGGGGHRSSFPPHGIMESLNITADRIKNPNKSLKDLIIDNDFKPMFPYGGEAFCQDILSCYETGKGSLSLRSKIEKDDNKATLTITEIPYSVTLDKIKEKIKEMHKEGKIEGLKNIADGTQNKNVRLILQYTKSTDLDFALNQLYSINPIKIKFDFDTKLVLDNKLIETNLLDIIDKWLLFRKSTIKRLKTFKIKDLRNRIHIIEGLLVVLDKKNIDKLIKIVKDAKGRDKIVETIKNTFGITEPQAKYVSEMKLYNINNIEINNLVEEKKEKEKIVNSEITIMKSNKLLEKIIIDELDEIKRDKNTSKPKRLTVYNDKDFNNVDKSELVKDEDFLMIITKQNKLKKVKDDVSKPQKRNGKGISIGKLADNDLPMHIFNANSRDNIFLVTEDGKLFYHKVYDLPEIKSLNSLGKDLTRFTKGTNIVKAFTLTDEEFKNPDTAFVVTTKHNRIKMLPLDEITRSGVILIKLADNDKVINVHNVNSKVHFNLVAVSTKGNIISFSKDLIPLQKRNTMGSAIFANSTINENNSVASTILDVGQEELVIVSRSSLAKRIDMKDIPVKSRSIKGVIAAKFKDDRDEVMYISMVDNTEDNLILITKDKTINVPLSEVNTYKRTTYGNPLMKLKKDEFCLDASLISQ